jgi:hypothetical protein
MSNDSSLIRDSVKRMVMRDGEADYHRRLLTPNSAKIDIISTGVLSR